MTGPHGTQLVLAGGPQHVDGAVAILRHQSWNTDVDDDRLARAHQHSAVWMLLVDADQGVVATARAITDGHKSSYIADVAVHDDWRGKGLGRFLIERLLDHPQIRGTRADLLTVNAGDFYARLGFERRGSLPYRFAWTGAPATTL
jgi:predicted GNAT family acetyltransferase